MKSGTIAPIFNDATGTDASMSNIDAANALFTAISYNRFDEIGARHAPNVRFSSFIGPHLTGSVAVQDWHRTFRRDYADCTYTEIEAIEEGNTVCARATLEAKGYDWRPFTQRVVDVLHFSDGLVSERQLYGMLRDIELDKVATKALEGALEFRGGNVNETRKATETLFTALLSGELEPAKEVVSDKAVLIDGVYGLATGLENIAALFASIPQPAFGIPRITASFAGAKDALVEISVDPARPRAAYWVRMVEGKIAVVEGYWMLREVGVEPRQNYARDRHMRQVIMPI